MASRPETVAAAESGPFSTVEGLEKGTPVAVLSSLVLAWVLTWWPGAEPVPMLARHWFFAMVGVLWLRIALWAIQRYGFPGGVPARLWIWLHRVAFLATGLLWGAAGVLFVAVEPVTAGLLPTLVILLIGLGSATWLWRDTLAFVAVILPALAGLALGHAVVGGAGRVASAGAIAVFGCGLLIAARKLRRRMIAEPGSGERFTAPRHLDPLSSFFEAADGDADAQALIQALAVAVGAERAVLLACSGEDGTVAPIELASVPGELRDPDERHHVHALAERAVSAGECIRAQSDQGLSVSLPLRRGGRSLGAMVLSGVSPDSIVLDSEQSRPLIVMLELLLEAECQRRRADQEAAARRRFSMLASQQAGALVVTDDRGRIEWTNDAFERMFGYRREAVAGRVPTRLLRGPATDPSVLSRLHQCFATGSDVDCEIALHDRNGDVLWVRVQCAPLRDESGRSSGYIAAVSDVGEQHRWRAQLENQLEAMRALYDIASTVHLDTAEQIGRAVELGRRVLGLDIGLVCRIGAGRVRVEYSSACDPSPIGSGDRTMLVGTLFEEVLERRDVVAAADLATTEQGMRSFFGGVGCAAFIGVPIEVGGKVIAVLSFSSVSPRCEEFSRPERVWVRLLGRWIASLLERETSREKLEKLVSQVPGMIYQFERSADGTMRFPYTSAGSIDVYGYPPEVLAEDVTKLAEILHPDDAERVWRSIEESAERLEVWQEQYRVVDADGGVRWLEGRAKPERTGDGDTLWHGYISDITARRQVEVARERSRNRLRALFQRSPVGIVLSDVETRRFVDANPAALRLLALTHEALTKLTHDDLTPAEYRDADQAQIEKLLSGGDYGPYERPVLRGDGSMFEARLNGMLLETDQGQRLICTLAEDVSEQRALEQKLRALNADLERRVDERTREVQRESRQVAAILDTTRDGFLALDRDTRVLRTNPAMASMLAVEAGSLVGRSVSDFEAQMAEDEILAHFDRVRQLGWEVFETRLLRDDGSEVAVEVSMSGTVLESGEIFYAFVRDIDERKQAERELQQAQREAERANRAKTEFLSRMSHELRTPLNAIMGFAQLLEYDEAFPADGLQRDNLREISLAGRHLMTLVDEVLDLSRIEQGRLEIELESFRLAPLVNECVSLIRAVAAERGIEIGSAVDERTVIRADRTRLKEVLLNFLSNAVKYNRAEGRVQVSTPDSDPGWTRIQVDDTGPGIERSDLDRLFRPFERLEGALEGTEGTGIGLALAKMLAEAMGGRVGVDSEPGVGSAFWIELPAADGDEPHFWSQRLPAAADTRPRRLVYIEDNPANMRLVRKALATRADLELFEAVDAEQGLELIRRCVPDAVLLDLNLPGRSGMAVLDELKRDVTVDQVPVIAVSANAMPEDVRGALGSGLAAYITKPISIPHFLATVDEVLESEAPEAH